MTDHSPTSRGFAGYGAGIFAGIVSAGILALSLSCPASPAIMLMYLVALPLFITGFGAGVTASLIAVIFGASLLIALTPAAYAVLYLAIYGVPVVSLVLLGLSFRALPEGKIEWCSEGKILTALAAYPCLIFLAVYAVTMQQHGGLLAMTLDAFNGMNDQVIQMLTSSGQTVTPEMAMMLHQYFDNMARIAPALVMCAWLVACLVSILLAQSVLQSRKWNLRPAFSLAQLHVPTWVIFAAALTGCVAIFAPAPYNYIGLNLALLMGVPFFFVGLAVAHAWAATTRMPTLALVIFYVMICAVVHLVLLVAMLGAIDQWVDFRKYFADQKKTTN